MRTTVLINPEDLSERWIRRAADHGYGGIGIHPGGGEPAADALRGMLDLLKMPSYRAMLDRAADAGLSIEYEIHAAGYLYSRDRFAVCPETFRMDASGKRTPDRNFCFSDREVLREAAERARTLVGQLYRSEHRYYLWADDSRDAFCHCPVCAGWNASDQALLFMNGIVRALRKDIPDAKVAYLAYEDTMDLPSVIRPEEGIFLEYAPFDRDMHRPIAEQDEKHAGKVGDLLHLFGRADAKALAYWFDNSYFSNWTKPPKRFAADEPVLRADLRTYRDLGFEAVSTFACFLGSDYEDLYGEPELPRLDV